MGARAEGRRLSPQAVARGLSGKRAGALLRARRGGEALQRRVRLRDCAGPGHPPARRVGAPGARCEARAPPKRRHRDIPPPVGRHRARGRRVRASGRDRELVLRRRGARRVPDGLRGHRRLRVPTRVRAEARSAHRPLLDWARSRVARHQPRGARLRGRAFPRPRAAALGQLSRQRLRAEHVVSRTAARTRRAARRRQAARNRRERDGAGRAVEARPRDGRGMGARSGGVRPDQGVRARARRARGGGGRGVAAARSRACGCRAAGRRRVARGRALARRRRGDRSRAPRALRLTDVAVYGATAAGVAAVAAARAAGARTVLVEPGMHVGGVVSGGLSWTDVGDVRVLGGFARRFYAAVAERYGAGLWEVKGPEPHVAEEVLTSFLDGADVHLATTDVPDAAVYVDASYEGDLTARLGVSYAVGRASRELYGETWAGRQPAYRPGKHNSAVTLSPFADDGLLLPFIREPELDERGWPAERLGEGDGGLQAYGYRVCLTDRDANRIPFTEPEGYDASEFELLARYLAAVGVEPRDLLGLVPDLLPNGKCDVNSIGPFSLNLLDGSNRAYPDGDDAVRALVRERHLGYTQCFLFYLANDAPPHVRAEVARWGLCADEFTGSDGWPHQLYVRDARRMLGEDVLREPDLLDGAGHDDVIALGSYNIDVREVARTWR